MYENFDEAEGSPECEFIPRSLPKPDASDSDKKVDLCPVPLLVREFIDFLIAGLRTTVC